METGADDGLLYVLTSDPETDRQTYFFKVFYLLHIEHDCVFDTQQELYRNYTKSKSNQTLITVVITALLT